MKTKILLSSLLAVVIGLIIQVPGTLAAFGISPPWITNENLKPGSSFVYIIDMSTDKPTEDMMVKTEVTGDPEIIKWVTIRNQDNLIMPKGLNHVPMYIDLRIPNDAKAGKYEGDIGITIIPEAIANSNINILLGGHIAVKLGVVNYDVIDYVINTISIKPVTEGGPLVLNVQLKNLGNVSISKVKTSIEVIDFKTGAFVAKGSADALSVPIYPQTKGEATLSVPIEDLEAGNYWVNANVTKNGLSVYKNKLYLLVKSNGLNNVLKTSVSVGNEEDFKDAATPYGLHDGNNVRVKTSVTVRAPFTNKLIGIVIVLLGILIIIAARTQKFLFKKFGKRFR